MTSKQKSQTIAPYGSWKSKITSDLIIQKNIKFGEIQVLNSTDKSKNQVQIVYVENRPSEKGRAALVKRIIDLDSKVLDLDEQLEGKGGEGEGEDGKDLTLGKFNSRSGIHEYGGGSVRSDSNGGIFFTDYDPKSFGVYSVKEEGEQRESGEPQLVTPDNPLHRFGDFSPHPSPSISHFVSILEDHTHDTPSQVLNSLVLVDPTTKSHQTLVSGSDFYSNATFSKEGTYLAWVEWNHPEMPFWNTELWVAKFDTAALVSSDSSSHQGLLSQKTMIRRFDPSKREVIHQPLWNLDPNHSNRLFYTSDRTGYSNLYFLDVQSTEDSTQLKITESKSVLSEVVETDFQDPAWTLNNSSYIQLCPKFLVCTQIKGGFTQLSLIHLPSSTLHPLRTFYNYISFGQLRRIDSTHLICAVGGHDLPSELVVLDLEDCKRRITEGVKNGIQAGGDVQINRESIKVIKRSSKLIKDGILDQDWISQVEEIEYPTKLPDGSSSTAHALLLPPKNPNFSPPAGTSPPCITFVHGGPTAAAHAGFNLNWSYWTSRGWLVCVVNYGGSTGYGRKFMERLDSKWGITDVLDCVHAAKFLGSVSSSTPSTSSSMPTQSSSKDLSAQESALKESRQANGAVELQFDNWTKAWTWSDGIIAAALSIGSVFSFTNLGSSVVQFSELRYPLGLAAATWLFGKMFRVQNETVNAIPSMGLQLSTTRGLSLPRSLASLRSSVSTEKNPFWISSYSSHFIARDSILDVMVTESFKRWNVGTQVVVATKASRSRGSREALEKGIGEEGDLKVLFPSLSPRLPLVQRIFSSIYPVVFGDDSTSTLQSSSSIPRADPNKLVISGGSAGGYTVLACLTDHPNVYNAGTSLYGVSDVTALAHESHKFESRYPLVLMGGTPEEIPEVYHERSPLFKADKIKAPILVLQGSEDKIVPPNQSEEISKAVEKNGGITKYILFEGEGHGFRQSENQKKALEAEEAWYAEVFAFEQH